MLVERMIHGSRMLLDTNDRGLSAQLINNGTREGQAPFSLEALVKPGWVCLDIGANLGFYALIEARCGGKVYAVEPVPNNVDILRKNVKLNGYDISVFEMALGDKTGIARFQRGPTSNWGYMMDMKAKRARGIGEIAVKETTLDRFVKERNISRVDLLRFDVDGYEVEMIEGAQKTLGDMPCGSWIFAELHPRCFTDPAKDLMPTLQNIMDHGFTPVESIGPPRALGDASPKKFPAMCCSTYKKCAPLVFLEKQC